MFVRIAEDLTRAILNAAAISAALGVLVVAGFFVAVKRWKR